MTKVAYINPELQGGRRSNARVRLQIPATFTLLSGAHKCLLSNLSRSGARVAIDPPPKVGDCGILRCTELDAFCVVVWVHGGECGVEFEDVEPIDLVQALRWYSDNYSEYQQGELLRTVREWVSGGKTTGG